MLKIIIIFRSARPKEFFVFGSLEPSVCLPSKLRQKSRSQKTGRQTENFSRGFLTFVFRVFKKSLFSRGF